MNNLLKKSLIRLGLSSAILCSALPSYAGGFQLLEASVSLLGNSFAGSAAAVYDASTSWFNPAGMVLLPGPELVVAATAIDIEAKGHVRESTANSLLGLQFGEPEPVPVLGTSTVHPGEWVVIPTFHLALPKCHCFAFGLSMTSPFGLVTHYPDDSKVKYIATRSKVELIDVSPTVAVQVAPCFSVGAGLDIQYLKARLSQKVPVGETVVLPTVPPVGPFADGEFKNRASDENAAYGYNVGALYQFPCGGPRIGADYHSRTRHHLEGDANLIFIQPPVPSVAGPVSARVTLPDYADVSIYYPLNCQWAALGSVDWTHWSLLKQIDLHYSGTFAATAANLITLPLEFKDTYRVSLGANYSPNCFLTLRSGIAYDRSPIRSDKTRTFRLPDSDRYWASLGARIKANDRLYFDVAYSHLFIKHATVDQTQITNQANGGILFAHAIADFHNSVNEIGVQATWRL